jgi:hypothetical protein
MQERVHKHNCIDIDIHISLGVGTPVFTNIRVHVDLDPKIFNIPISTTKNLQSIILFDMVVDEPRTKVALGNLQLPHRSFLIHDIVGSTSITWVWKTHDLRLT